MNKWNSCIVACATVASLAVLASCGGDSGTGPGTAPNLSGDWTMSFTASNVDHETSCSATGPLNITQAGYAFTGSVTGGSGICTIAGNDVDGTPDGAVTNGAIVGDSASFVLGGCTLKGVITGSPSPTLVEGDASCTYHPVQGDPYPITGTWQMGR